MDGLWDFHSDEIQRKVQKNSNNETVSDRNFKLRTWKQFPPPFYDRTNDMTFKRNYALNRQITVIFTPRFLFKTRRLTSPPPAPPPAFHHKFTHQLTRS